MKINGMWKLPKVLFITGFAKFRWVGSPPPVGCRCVQFGGQRSKIIRYE